MDFRVSKGQHGRRSLGKLGGNSPDRRLPNQMGNRVTALAACRAAVKDWPRHEGTTGEEHELGVWLHRQRFELRRGELDPRKAAALDAAVPGWPTGTRPIRVRAKLLPSRGILLQPVQ